MKATNILLAAALIATACTKAGINSGNPSEGQTIRLSAYTDKDVKTTLDGVSVLWSESDAISIFSTEDYANTQFNIVSLSEDRKQAEFEGLGSNAAGLALYPYTGTATASAEGISGVTIPALQTAVENSFADGANPAACIKADGSTTLDFKNLGALISFTVNEDNIDWVEITADQPLCGKGDVSFVDGEPVFTLTEGVNSIMLKGSFTSGSKYYAVVAPASVGKLTFVFHKRSSAATLSSNAAPDVSLLRNGNYYIADFNIPSSKWINGIWDAEDLLDFGAKVTANEDYSNYKDESGTVNMYRDVNLGNVQRSESIIAHVKFTQTSNIYDFDDSGKYGHPFTGIFDGHGNTVAGLNISKNNSHMYSFSLFGGLKDATVKNVNVTGTGIFSMATNVKVSLGGIAGVAVSSTIENCNVSCTRIKGRLVKTNATNHRYAMGGIVGIANDCTVKNCTNNTRIGLLNGKDDGTNYTTNNGADAGQIGGICGFTSGNNGCSFEKCINKGQVGGYENGTTNIGGGARIGGIIGTSLKNIDIVDCDNYGEVNGTNKFASDKSCYVAGICSVTYDATTNIKNCTNYGTVTYSTPGESYKGAVGGIVSRPLNNKITIEGCKNFGTITSDYFGDGENVNNGVGLILGKPIAVGAYIKNCTIGGKIGPLDAASQIEITADNFSKFISGDWENSGSSVTITNCSFGTL